MKPELKIAITNVSDLVRASVWHQEYVRVRVEDVKQLLEVAKSDQRLPRDGVDLLEAGCPKCGTGLSYKPMGYVCTRHDCPWSAR